MQHTSIEWTATHHADGTVTPGYSSNPIRAIDRETGKRGWSCTKVSDGCQFCYAETLNKRWGTGLPYDRASESLVDWELSERELGAILRSRATGARVFVADMTDLFHVNVRRAWLDRIFATFALRPDLTFQCLTKRPALAWKYLADPGAPVRVVAEMHELLVAHGGRDCAIGGVSTRTLGAAPAAWPLPNVWLGTSVEDNSQRPRINLLKRAPAAIHFLSCEPLIGPLDLREGYLEHIEWVITGGESGPRHRPLDPAWVRAIRDECLARGVAYLHKQNGGLTPKSGGRELDGRVWDGYPRAVTA